MKQLSHSKKGQALNTLGPTMIVLIIASVFLILGLVMLQEIRNTDIISKDLSGTDTDTSLTLANAQVTLTQCAAQPGGAISAITSVYNSTTLLTSGNYTYSGCVLDMGSSIYNTSLTNVTYTYTYGGTAYEQGNESIAGLGTFGSFWEIIVLAIVISIVIGLLLATFGRRTTR